MKVSALQQIADQYSNLKELTYLDELRGRIDALRPWPSDVQGRIMQKFRLDWNYHSNAIEGNSLDYGETIAFLMEGLTAKGKPLKDHLDIRGHNQGIDFMMGLIQAENSLTERDIRSLHEIILVEPYEVDAITPNGNPTRKRIELGVYKSQPNHVRTPTGELHYYATPEETPILMHELVAWYQQAGEAENLHPLVLAVLFHHRFTSIHPFDDGNGRLARLLMNFILMRRQFPPIVVRQENRNAYYAALNQADQGVYQPLFEYLYKGLERSLKLQLSGLLGEEITEPDDLDKEIALFVQGIELDEKLKASRNPKILVETLSSVILPFLLKLREKTQKLDVLFIQVSEKITEEYQKPHPPSEEKEQLTYEDSIIDTFAGEPVLFRHLAHYPSLAEWKKQLVSDPAEEGYDDLDRFVFTIQWQGFQGKNTLGSGELNLLLQIEFSPYHYLLRSENTRETILNGYQTPLDPTESQAFIASQVRHLMQEIQRKAGG